MSDEDVAAPNFRGSQYPGAGERIGPAWREVWSALADRKWHDVRELKHRALGVTDVKWQTVGGILAQARREGILEVDYRMTDQRVRAFYRRPS